MSYGPTHRSQSELRHLAEEFAASERADLASSGAPQRHPQRTARGAATERRTGLPVWQLGRSCTPRTSSDVGTSSASRRRTPRLVGAVYLPVPSPVYTTRSTPGTTTTPGVNAWGSGFDEGSHLHIQKSTPACHPDRSGGISREIGGTSHRPHLDDHLR